MTSEQLQTTRAARWRHASNPILTADDAREWIDGTGFSLFLPRRAHFAAPAPSFVEAVAGAPSDAPSREAIENAHALLHRLTAEGAVVPLNLLGATGAVVAAGASDQPDFLVSRAALPYVFSLVGGRNWKTSPGGKASPLMTEVWTLLDGEGALTAQEIQTALGRELTEAAVLRALVELWNGLRVIPVYDGEVTRWELTQARFAAEMTASQKVAQTTALSALVSLYLEAAVAASTEEIEVFLSPLTARSRVREVVNGLQATRQLGIVSVAAQPLLHVAGALPEFPDVEPVEVVLPSRTERKPYSTERKPYNQDRKPYVPRERSGFDRKGPARERSAGPRERTQGSRERSGPPRERTGFGRSAAPGSGGERPYRRPEDRRPSDRKPFDGDRKPFGKKPFDKSAKPFGSRPSSGSRPSYGSKPSGARPFDKERAGGERARPSYGASGADRPAKRFGAGGARPWQDRGASPGERPIRPRREEAAGAERGRERRPASFGGEKKFDGPRKFDSGKKFGAPKKFGPPKFGRTDSRPGSRSSSGPRSTGARSFGSGGSRPSGPRSSGARESRPAGRGGFSGGFKREQPGEKRPFFRERPAKAADGESRPRAPRSDSRADRGAGGWKPKPSGGGFSKTGKPGFKSSGKPAFKSGGKPGFKKAGDSKFKKPFGKSAKPAGRGGKPAFGKGKPGGFKPPARKRKEGGGDAE